MRTVAHLRHTEKKRQKREFFLFLAVSVSAKGECENHLGAALIQPVDYVIVINEWFINK